ncbi:MAG TPA: hypothetical protein VJ625_14805 [Propionibacteriaceae bacterium]|nr:hypothetical protein [Propionibacteriaceae bacterium]
MQASEILKTASAVSPSRNSTADSSVASSRSAQHRIKIAPSIYYARAKTPITIAELAESNLVNWRTCIRPTGRLWRWQAVQAAATPALRLAATRSAG